MADPFSLVRALNRMRAAGFEIRAAGDLLQVSSIGRLTDPQRAYLQANKAALLVLLADAETLASALAQAGPAGLDWREGTPADWDDTRLLVAGEVLYGDGRMGNAHGRRCNAERAPPSMMEPDISVDMPSTQLMKVVYEEHNDLHSRFDARTG